ncbi:DNA alkylation repair protein [Sphingobacterium spiritivorum]|uniref:DNA alkylation repair protein n=1 Tax=Sphingobacterium spiritivorum TaxID=258 RepID=UPI001919B65E|nr:DNA alkylation repair protein [Sphingobacterium spiritivorum]QQT24963.1 DNA alkylation repair protein [Sphingobacterium spiritivorum]
MKDEKRKGARSAKDIPAEDLEQLNSGSIQSANLTEWLAIDQRILLVRVLSQLNREHYIVPVSEAIDKLQKQTVNTINETIGNTLLALSVAYSDLHIQQALKSHYSDMVRCWATYLTGSNENLSIAEKLEQIQFFAADSHFGVREIAWMAVRSSIIQHLEESIRVLTVWTAHENENIRRFASESIRPRGVWCAHIERLKKQPELGMPVLDQLKSDSSKYVRDSVGNWLNDASKHSSAFVLDTCSRWKIESPTKETLYILKKAMRTLNKQG